MTIETSILSDSLPRRPPSFFPDECDSTYHLLSSFGRSGAVTRQYCGTCGTKPQISAAWNSWFIKNACTGSHVSWCVTAWERYTRWPDTMIRCISINLSKHRLQTPSPRTSNDTFPRWLRSLIPLIINPWQTPALTIHMQLSSQLRSARTPQSRPSSWSCWFCLWCD